MPVSEPIVVAGAGPVGLSLALGLARRGVRSVVLEKKPQLSTHSKAVLVTPRTLEIFHEWRVLETFKSAGEWLEVLSPVDSRTGEEVLCVDFSALRPISSAAGICVLPQNETERLLYEICVASGLVEVRFGHAITTFDSDDSGVRVRVQGPEDQYVLESSLLCGCDGAHSTVREGLGLHLEGKTYPAHAILADVRIEDERDARPWPRIDLHAQGFAFAVRFASGYWRIVLAQKGEAVDEIPSPEFVHARVHDLIGEGPSEIVWSSGFKIHCRNAPHFRIGRILLLGDAAHLNSPAGGQGMNAGIQDAHNLAWKIERILKGGDAELFLKSYDAERFDAITRDVDVATDRLTRFGVTGPTWMRSAALFLLKRLIPRPGVTRRATSSLGMLNLRYDESDLIDASGGRYLPDVELGDGLRLRQALGTQGGLVEITQDTRKLTVADATYDLSSDASAEIAKAGGPFIAVRPDHVVAYSGGSRERAESYLALLRVP
ncbi:MAG TPA: FAD-dependent monooxygenase [Fimbriimonadaceae bacterium]|nr:FAD-dependent monooxygenase [Fimbriimonadaceae bacterium]